MLRLVMALRSDMLPPTSCGRVTPSSNHVIITGLAGRVSVSKPEGQFKLRSAIPPRLFVLGGLVSPLPCLPPLRDSRLRHRTGPVIEAAFGYGALHQVPLSQWHAIGWNVPPL